MMAKLGHNAVGYPAPSNLLTSAIAHDNATVHVGNNYCLPKDDYLAAIWVTDPKMDKERIEDAKGGLHTQSYAWILKNRDFQSLRKDPASHLLWIKGDPGKGKTMLLCGIINELTSSTLPETLIAYFFCQATDERLNNATAVFRGLTYMLIKQQRPLGNHVRERYEEVGKQLFEDPNAGFVMAKILIEILKDERLKGAYIVVDALDECDKDLHQLLDLIKRTASARIKWILSSRHQDGIEYGLQLIGPRIGLSLELMDNAEEVERAVEEYIAHCVSKLSHVYDQQTRDRLQHVMRQKAHGTFLWVSLVFQEIGKTRLLRRELEKVMTEIPVTLEGLYLRMIDHIRNLGWQRPELCRRLLATVTTALRPLRFEELGVVSDLDKEYSGEIENIANMCRSFLTIRGKTVSIIHQSAKDFLSGNEFLFPSGIAGTHRTMFFTSLLAMSETLQRNIYRLERMDHTIVDIKKPEEGPLASIQYSCVFWVDHLKEGLSAIGELALDQRKPAEDHKSWTKIPTESRDTLEEYGLVHKFLMDKYLFWLEALSLLRSIPEVAIAMTKLERFLESRTGNRKLLEFVRDGRRFCARQSYLMKDAPLQVYASALLFSPRQSTIRKHFEAKEMQWITTKPVVEDYWKPCLATVTVDENRYVASVMFSPDGKYIASRSNFNTVTVWHADTGEFQARFEDDSISITSIAFSTCSKRLAIGSRMKIKLWCIETASCQMTLKFQGGSPSCIAFLPDGARLASASADSGNVVVWDIATRNPQSTLHMGEVATGFRTKPNEPVRCMSFSPNGQVLVLRMSSIELWDAITGDCQWTLRESTRYFQSVAISKDGRYIATITEGGTVQLWNPQTGAHLRTCIGHEQNHNKFVSHPGGNRVAFSPDGNYLASGSSDSRICVWDPNTGRFLAEFAGHTGPIQSVAFSPDSQCLASGSKDSTFKLWDLRDINTQTTTEKSVRVTSMKHDKEPSLIAFSPDNRHVASVFSDGTVKLWNTSTGKCVITTKACVSPVFSANSKHFSTYNPKFSRWESYGLIKVWDLETYEVRHEFEVNGNVMAMMEMDTGECHKVARCYQCFPATRLSPGLSFHPNGNYLNFNDDFDDRDGKFPSNRVRSWETSSKRFRKSLKDKVEDDDRNGDQSYYPQVRLEDVLFKDQHLTPAARDTVVGSCGLSDDGRWVTYQGQNEILLPLDYLMKQGGTKWESSDNMIAIAGGEDNLIIIGFGKNSSKCESSRFRSETNYHQDHGTS